MAVIRLPGYKEKLQSGDEEQKLLKLACQGSVEAFGTLYEQLSPAVFRFMIAHVSNAHDAEDLTADVFMRAWEALPRYRQQGVPFLAYLLRIARNLLIDFYRKKENNIQTEAVEDNFEIPDKTVGLLENMQAFQDRQELYLALRNLREEHRTVLVLRFIEGYDVEKTAYLMERTQSGVRVLTHRALSSLRAQLEITTEK